MTADELMNEAVGEWIADLKDVVPCDVVEQVRAAYDDGAGEPNRPEFFALAFLGARLLERRDIPTTDNAADWQVGTLLMMRVIAAARRLERERLVSSGEEQPPVAVPGEGG